MMRCDRCLARRLLYRLRVNAIDVYWCRPCVNFAKQNLNCYADVVFF